MELVAYSSHSARQHVQKFRELLRYPPAIAEGMGPGAKSGNGKKQKGKSKKREAPRYVRGLVCGSVFSDFFVWIL